MADGRPVLLRVRSVSGDEELDVRVSGVMRPRGDSLLFTWRERLAEDDGLSEETEVSLMVRDGHAVMQRKGPWSVTMVFDPPRERESVYHTPYGDLDVRLRAHEVRLAANAEDGSLRIVYGIAVQGGPPDRRTLDLEWRHV